ncbi:hypothetical protein J7E96_12015 [Streptomyces sp. ISL-96]|uniref:hypothetical protein n=1 Tax=unclassified Streptomyces TaxID=2593676 RepID=UPI001BED3B7A|nr:MULTISPECIES: hypothetical protein [unclassified Streptomyces]MBT2398120.1 hypothetical protein [Streptomyces sp. ISL-100]MBT2489235.1 hypothetical protein [Streptomyces sp. ISL-96]
MIILDTSSVLAIARGHRKLLRVADNAAASPFRHLLVPALCLMQAEITDAGSGMSALALPGIDIEPLDTVSSVAVATMVRDGLGGPDVCHALYASLPSPQRPQTDLILTDREDDYPPGTVTVDIDDDRLDD